MLLAKHRGLRHATRSHSMLKARRTARLSFSTSVEHKKLPSGGSVAHLWFSGEKKYPILNPPAIAKLSAELRTLNESAELRALFLRSTIAGADINYMATLKSPSQAENFIRSVDGLCSSLQNFRAPVIAIVSGPCMGAGMEVAASCDFRIAVDGPKPVFAMPETKIGIPSVVQASLLPGLIGWGRARHLLYFGGQLSASEALANGFVNELVTDDNLPDLLANWEKMIDETEPQAVAAQKALMRVSRPCAGEI